MGGPGRFSFSVSILQPDQLKGAGFLIRAEGQGQRKGSGLVLLTLGGKELLVLSGRGEENGHDPLQGRLAENPPGLTLDQGHQLLGPGLELSQETLPISRDLLIGHRLGEENWRHLDAFQNHAVQVSHLNLE